MGSFELRSRILVAIGAGGLVVLAASACGSSTSDGGADTSPNATLHDPSAADANADSAAADASTGDEGGGAEADAQDDVKPDRLSIRRPLLVGASLRSASLVARGDWVEPIELGLVYMDARTAAALAEAYASDGCEEHASIAAFARLTLHLLAVGAPPDLIEKAHCAALDEVRHARQCFALAARYGGGSFGPAPLPLHDLFDAGATELADIAALCAEEGCVGETLGVLLASEALSLATDPPVVRMLTRMLEEEEMHVALAWQFVAWCIARGGEPVRAAVAHAVQRAIDATLATPLRHYAGVDLDVWHAHGRVSCQEARAVAVRGIREIIEPCVAALLAAPPPEGHGRRMAPDAPARSSS